MAAGPEQRLNPEDRANLVAYVDGELSEAEARSIATKLTQSATARREVDAFKKTWELLDYLPRPAASQDFSERTYSAIHHLESQRNRWAEDAGSWLARASRGLLALAVGAGLALGGFSLSRWAWPDPVERLASELSLIENLEEYREVGSFGLLEELARSSIFGSDESEVNR